MGKRKLRMALMIGLVMILVWSSIVAIAEKNRFEPVNPYAVELSTEEESEIEIEQIKKEVNESWLSTLTTFATLEIILLILAGITSIILLRKQKNKFVSQIDFLKKRMSEIRSEADARIRAERIRNNASISSLRRRSARELDEFKVKNENEVKELKETVASLQNGLELYREQYRRAVVLHPNLTEEINRMIIKENEERDIKSAREFDNVASDFDGRSATRHMVDELKKTLDMYANLSPAQKSLVKANVNRLRQMLDEAIAFEKKYEQEKENEQRKQSAKTAETKIQSIMGDIKVGIATDYAKLSYAKRIYDELDHETAKFVDQALIDKLIRLFYEAKKDRYGV